MKILIISLLLCFSLFAQQNLDELVARKARHSTASWGKDYLESANYIWQPERVTYIDTTSGLPVTIIIKTPDVQTIYSKEYNNQAWSFDSFGGFWETQTEI